MIAVLIAAILFGLVHPGAKLILDLGVTLIPFCMLYIAMRLIVQIPIVLGSGAWRIHSLKEASYLGLLGLTGAALQFTEFYGVADGLPVSVVSFLVYTHPVWTLIFSRVFNKEKITGLALSQIIVAIVGIALITGPSLSDEISFIRFALPLTAGIMIALWITISNCAAKAGSKTKTISFYYDFIALVAISALSYNSSGATNFFEALNFVKVPLNFSWILVYSILVGLIPNYLFYYGSKNATALMAGLILLVEPVVSAVVSNILWEESITALFAVGALCIVFANAPKRFFLGIKAKLLSHKPNLARRSLVFCLSSLTFFVGKKALAAKRPTERPKLHVVEIVSFDTSNYTVLAEMNQMKEAFQLAHKEYKTRNTKCEVDVEYVIKRGTENELFSFVEKISKKKNSPVIVGFSRSIFARIAAKAAVGTPLKGVAVGASATNLRDINPNFVSVASPQIRQWAAVSEKIHSLSSCGSASTIGIFDSTNQLSTQFKDDFFKSGFNQFQEISEDAKKNFHEHVKSKTCVFMALNFSDAKLHLEQLITKKWKGNIFGVGDWNIFSDEINKLFRETKHEGITAFLPSGWHENVTRNSKRFSQHMKAKTGQSPSPIGAYSYDAMLIALETICGGFEYKDPPLQALEKLRVLRNYEGVSNTGNYLSKILLIELKSGRSSNEKNRH